MHARYLLRRHTVNFFSIGDKALQAVCAVATEQVRVLEGQLHAIGRCAWGY